MNKAYVLITGAGSGIGKALSIEFAKRGYNILMVSKPGEDLPKLSFEIKTLYKVGCDYLECDLLSESGPQDVFDWTLKKQFQVFGLVNNAGLGGSAAFSSQPKSSSLNMMNLNMLVPVMLSRNFLPAMKKLEKGFIMNIGSIVSKMPSPYKIIYSSSKKFIESFSVALRQELKKTNIQVSLVLPGPTNSNDRIIKEYNSQPKLVRKYFFTTPDKVAKRSVDGLLKGQFKIIPDRSSGKLVLMHKMIPSWFRNQLLKSIWKNVASNSG